MPEPPRSVGLLGGGVIGGGWAARFLLNGVAVRLFDPAPSAEGRVREMLDNARRAYRSLTMVPLPAEGELSFVGSVEDAVEGAEFVAGVGARTSRGQARPPATGQPGG